MTLIEQSKMKSKNQQVMFQAVQQPNEIKNLTQCLKTLLECSFKQKWQAEAWFQEDMQ